MTLQVEFWTVVGFLITFMSFVGGMAKWLFSKAEERQAARFASLEQSLQQSASNWGELEKEFMRFKADLPLNYVRSSRPSWTHSTTNWKWYSSTVIQEVTMVDIARVRRESLRWSLLVALNKTRPYTASETLLLDVSRAIYQDTTPLELRRELDYLADRKMVDLEKKPSGDWFADLTRLGVDLVEYTVECGPGIARPEKYWSE